MFSMYFGNVHLYTSKFFVDYFQPTNVSYSSIQYETWYMYVYCSKQPWFTSAHINREDFMKSKYKEFNFTSSGNRTRKHLSSKECIKKNIQNDYNLVADWFRITLHCDVNSLNLVVLTSRIRQTWLVSFR